MFAIQNWTNSWWIKSPAYTRISNHVPNKWNPLQHDWHFFFSLPFFDGSVIVETCLNWSTFRFFFAEKFELYLFCLLWTSLNQFTVRVNIYLCLVFYFKFFSFCEHLTFIFVRSIYFLIGLGVTSFNEDYQIQILFRNRYTNIYRKQNDWINRCLLVKFLMLRLSHRQEWL